MILRYHFPLMSLQNSFDGIVVLCNFYIALKILYSSDANGLSREFFTFLFYSVIFSISLP